MLKGVQVLQARLLSVLLLLQLGLFAGLEGLVLQSRADTRALNRQQSLAVVPTGTTILKGEDEGWDDATGSSDPFQPPSLSSCQPNGLRSSQQDATRLLHISRHRPCAAPQTGPPIHHATA